MAIRNCPKCSDPNFDDGACGCGWCKKCKWRQTCTQGGWYDENFGQPIAPLEVGGPIIPIGDGVVLDTLSMGTAGASIERSAHEQTLELLRRARDILSSIDEGIMPLAGEIESLFADIKKYCPKLDEE